MTVSVPSPKFPKPPKPNNTKIKSNIDTNEFLKRLKECESMDTENCHMEADSILCELLEILGYTELVETFHNLTKWYS